MRDNSKDLTLERNYIQKWRFLIHEYQLVKAKKQLLYTVIPVCVRQFVDRLV